MTFAELKAQLDAFTAEQLAAEVVWVGDERGGKIKQLWVAEEDWVGDRGNWETAQPRSQWERDSPEEVAGMDVMIRKGTPQLMVD